MKILIEQQTVIYDKEHDSIGILVQDNIGRNKKWDWTIDYGEVLCRMKVTRGVDKQEAFNKSYEILGEI